MKKRELQEFINIARDKIDRLILSSPSDIKHLDELFLSFSTKVFSLTVRFTNAASIQYLMDRHKNIFDTNRSRRYYYFSNCFNIQACHELSYYVDNDYGIYNFSDNYIYLIPRLGIYFWITILEAQKYNKSKKNYTHLFYKEIISLFMEKVKEAYMVK